jgi:hypothetical protein
VPKIENRSPTQTNAPDLRFGFRAKASPKSVNAGDSLQLWKTHLLVSGTSPLALFGSSRWTGKREIRKVHSALASINDERLPISSADFSWEHCIKYSSVSSVHSTNQSFDSFDRADKKQFGHDVSHKPFNGRIGHSHEQSFSARLKRINHCRDMNWVALRGIGLMRRLPASSRM